MKDIINRIKEVVQDNKVIIGVSTGPDSSVLLDLTMKTLKKEQIVVAHINHKVRAQADIEEDYLKHFCEDNNLTFRVSYLPKVESNFEEEARDFRYEFFRELCKEYNTKYIMLAHHANDNLETIIMRFLHKSYVKGYAGMEEIAHTGDFIYFRPLLYISKDDIISYADKNNIKYFLDHTNYEHDHLRNRIRLDIIPLLEKENPKLVDAVNYYSKQILALNELLEEKISDFTARYIYSDESTIKINLHEFNKLNDDLKYQIFFRTLRRYGLSITNIKELLKKIASSKSRIVENNGKFTFIKEYNSLIFTTLDLENEFYLEISKEGIYDLPNGGNINVSKNICVYSFDNISVCYNIDNLPIIVRTRKDNDYLIRTDKANQSFKQTLSNYYTNKKTPYIKRCLNLLVCKDSQVLVILGEKFK